MKKVLIVVDMLNDFCDPKGALATSPITGKIYAGPIISAVKAVVDKFRKSMDIIIWLSDAHVKNDKEFERFPKHAVKGTWGSLVIDELRPDTFRVQEYVIEKARYSGFYDTTLGTSLHGTRAEEITVVGVCTSICCLMTVVGLANRDYNIVVPKLCVADFDPGAHEFALKYMKNILGVKIT